jgi:hypothetical protein
MRERGFDDVGSQELSYIPCDEGTLLRDSSS